MKRTLFISALLLLVAACSTEMKEPDCTNQPALRNDCMSKSLCGVDNVDNPNYLSCKYLCDFRIEKQCRMYRRKS